MKKQRLAIVLMTAVLLMAMFTVSSSAASSAEIGAKINQIKGGYIGKSYGSGGCHAFVNAFSQALFGVAAPQTDGATRLKTNANWYFVASGSDNSSVLSVMKTSQPGDIVRYKCWYINKAGERKETMHSAMVTAVSGSGISIIHHTDAGGVKEYYSAWSQLFSSTALGSFDGGSSYGLGLYRCNQVNGGGTSPVHTSHVKGTYKFAEAAHPHYKYWECSVCGQLFTDGSTEKSSSCTTCYPPVSVSATVTTTGVDGISESAATVRGSATASGGKITEVGMYFGTSSNNLTKLGSDSGSWNSMTFYYNTTKFGRTLSPGTTYYYKAYAIAGGKTFWGGVKSFTTTASTVNTTKTGWVTGTNGQALAINDKAAASPTYSNQIGRIPEGASCTVYTNKTSGNWYYVSYGGVSGYAYNKYITFSSPNPAKPSSTAASVSGQTVTVSWPDVANETKYDVYLVQAPWAWADIKYSKSVNANTTSCTFENVKPGNYAAFVISRPNADNIQSPWANLTVNKPPAPSGLVIKTNKSNYTLGETVTMTPSANNTKNYALSVWYGEYGKTTERVYYKSGFTGSVSFTPTKAGLYSIRVDALSDRGYGTYGEDYISDDIRFTVTEPVQIHQHNLTRVPEVKATCTSAGMEEYWYCAECGQNFPKSTVAGTPEGIITTFEDDEKGVYLETLIIPKLGHDYVNGYCTRCGEPDPSTDTIQTGDQNPFIDVNENDSYYDAVIWAYYADPQITNGIDATHFGPGQTVTRGQCVAFLWRAMGCPEPTSSYNPFKDVPSSQYYYKPVLWAIEEGITKGTSATAFSPNATLSTQHIITFLYRAKNPGQDGWSGDAYYWAADNKGRPFGVNINVDNNTPCPRGNVVQFLQKVQ